VVSISGPGSEWRNHGSILVDALAESAPQISVVDGARLVTGGSLVLTGHAAAMLDQGALFASLTDLAGGTLRGQGTVDGPVRNAGRVAPGDTAASELGILTFKDDYLQTDAGRLDIQLGGTTGGSEHDVLVVLGTATLGGELAVELVDGFFPQLDDTFFVLGASQISGGFARFSGLDLGGGLRLAVSYTDQFVRLKTVLVPEPATGGLLLLGLGALGGRRSRRSAGGRS